MKIYIGFECIYSDVYTVIVTTDKDQAIKEIKELSRKTSPQTTLWVEEFEDGVRVVNSGINIFNIKGQEIKKTRKH